MNNIDTLHTIYLVTMTAALIMLVITIVLFFAFNIIHVTARIFGLSRRKEIRKLSENSSFTNQLNAKGSKSQKIRGQVFTETGNLKDTRSPIELMGMGSQTAGPSGAGYGNSGMGQETERLETMMSNRPVYESARTADGQLPTVLDINSAQRLTGPPANYNFTITRRILMIHTEESI